MWQFSDEIVENKMADECDILSQIWKGSEIRMLFWITHDMTSVRFIIFNSGSDVISKS